MNNPYLAPNYLCLVQTLCLQTVLQLPAVGCMSNLIGVTLQSAQSLFTATCTALLVARNAHEARKMPLTLLLK